MRALVLLSLVLAGFARAETPVNPDMLVHCSVTDKEGGVLANVLLDPNGSVNEVWKSQPSVWGYPFFRHITVMYDSTQKGDEIRTTIYFKKSKHELSTEKLVLEIPDASDLKVGKRNALLVRKYSAFDKKEYEVYCTERSFKREALELLNLKGKGNDLFQ